MLPLPDLGALYWYDTHEKLVALVARFVHHIYGQNTGEDPEYVPHSFLLLVSGALRASGSFNCDSESIVAFGTMFLLQRLRYENPKACVPYFASAEDYFVAGMAIAQKYILDISMNNGQLVDATDGQYTITHLRTLERTMLGWLEYNVSMDIKQLEVFVRVTRWFYGDAPLYIMKTGSVVVPVEEGCWPYFGEQLLVPSIPALPEYNAPRCICTSCAEQYSGFLAALALYFPPPTYVPSVVLLSYNPDAYNDLQSLGRTSVITVRDEVVWEDFPVVGYAVKPDRFLSRKNNWNDVGHSKLRRPANELIERIDGVWHYLGTFKPISSEGFPPEVFRNLPERVRQRVVQLAGHKTHRDKLWSMLEDGNLPLTKITLQRADMNKQVWECLASGAGASDDGAQGNGSKEPTEDD
ncbi:hypothetical protein FOMPIDRAFT_1063603 [Fomitopsis schrenkii]|uniref:Cyclin N-terminal domain-containing protein n=1 Tax=Fomitopsis schrenkii TaxID=2126942 RepID=S8DIB8_FOMSC|nr:hypothetical protein FOMPIDRAFT_1063603 [Fomitopsis schrenkii]